MTSYCGHDGKWTDDDAEFRCSSPNNPYPYPKGFVSYEDCHQKKVTLVNPEASDSFDSILYKSENAMDGNPSTSFLSVKNKNVFWSATFKSK